MNALAAAIVGVGVAAGLAVVYYGTKAAYRHIARILREGR